MNALPLIAGESWIIVGDALTELKTLPENSVRCCVTSPPYWSLRDYSPETAEWEGSNDPTCNHKVRQNPDISRQTSTITGGKKTVGHDKEGYGARCLRCGAVRRNVPLGLEEDPEEYIKHLVAIFHEVQRVLRPDGTLWLNLGDTYKDQQLTGIPWRVALALKKDGWYVRSDIIWTKPNAMPENVKNRPTRSHEYLFLLTKRPSGYLYAHSRIAEAASEGRSGKTRNRRSVWEIPTKGKSTTNFATFPADLARLCVRASSNSGDLVLDPFTGSGTTGRVALECHRQFIGVEIIKANAELARKNILTGLPMTLDFEEPVAVGEIDADD